MAVLLAAPQLFSATPVISYTVSCLRGEAELMASGCCVLFILSICMSQGISIAIATASPPPLQTEAIPSLPLLALRA